MKIRVNPEKCQGHNRCYSLVPELFEVDDLGNASAVNGGVVPDDMKEDAKLAVDNCPEFAIEIVEE